MKLSMQFCNLRGGIIMLFLFRFSKLRTVEGRINIWLSGHLELSVISSFQNKLLKRKII